MKLATFQQEDGRQQIGALAGGDGRIVLLQAGSERMEGASSPFFTDMRAFLRNGTAAREKAEAVIEYVVGQGAADCIVSLDRVSLCAPVPRPASIRDCMAFEQHIINCIRVAGLKRLAPVDRWIEKMLGRKRSIAYRINRAWYDRPVYYKGNRFSVVGHDAQVRMPLYTDRFDYELEWGVFIGSRGVDIPKDRAHEYIGGYTIFNDFSARDIQMREQTGRLGPAKGKDFDTGNAMGPWIVTPDEIMNPYDLTMTARVNGEEWSRGTTADMYWTFEDIIADVSRSEMLYPGEFIGSGTCSGGQGSGCGLEMGKFLKPGDVVELEVEGIGKLRNKVVSGQRPSAPVFINRPLPFDQDLPCYMRAAPPQGGDLTG